MTLIDVRLVRVKSSTHAEQLLSVHEATAATAYAHIFPGPFPRARERAKWVNHEGPVVMAMCGDEAVGFAAASGETLVGLFVLPSHAGRGIGTALVDAIGPVTRLWVLDQNEAARTFYQRRGWQWSGVGEVSGFSDDVSKLLYVRADQPCNNEHQ